MAAGVPQRARGGALPRAWASRGGALPLQDGGKSERGPASIEPQAEEPIPSRIGHPNATAKLRDPAGPPPLAARETADPSVDLPCCPIEPHDGPCIEPDRSVGVGNADRLSSLLLRPRVNERSEEHTSELQSQSN